MPGTVTPSTSLPPGVNLPADKMGRKAPRQAVIKPASFETTPDPADSGDFGQVNAYDAKFDCDLEPTAPTGDINLVARGTGDLVVAKGQEPVVAKVRNPATLAWQPLAGHVTSSATPIHWWTFRCRVPANFVTVPGREIALDLKAFGVGARVSTVQVTTA